MLDTMLALLASFLLFNFWGSANHLLVLPLQPGDRYEFRPLYSALDIFSLVKIEALLVT